MSVVSVHSGQTIIVCDYWRHCWKDGALLVRRAKYTLLTVAPHAAVHVQFTIYFTCPQYISVLFLVRIKQELVPLVRALCQDVDQEVRIKMCRELPQIAQALG